MSLFGGDSSGFGVGDVLGTVGALAGLYGLYDAYKGGGSASGSETVRHEPAPRTADGQTIWNAFMESLMGTGNWNKVQEERAAAAASPGTSILGNLTSSINGGGNSRGRTIMNGSGDIGGYESALGDRSISLSALGGLRDTVTRGVKALTGELLPYPARAYNAYNNLSTIDNLNATLDEIASISPSSVESLGPYGIDPKTGLAINTFGYNSGSRGGNRSGGVRDAGERGGPAHVGRGGTSGFGM